MAGRWTFYDSVSNTTYSFLANPTGDNPTYAKNLQFTAQTVPGGNPLMFEGHDTPTAFSISGDILTQAQYQSLLFFYNLRNQFLCTDDLGRQRWVYLTHFTPVRKLSRTYPWRYTYTISGYQFGAEVIPASANPNAPYPYAVP